MVIRVWRRIPLGYCSRDRSFFAKRHLLNPENPVSPFGCGVDIQALVGRDDPADRHGSRDGAVYAPGINPGDGAAPRAAEGENFRVALVLDLIERDVAEPSSGLARALGYGVAAKWRSKLIEAFINTLHEDIKLGTEQDRAMARRAVARALVRALKSSGK
jgi:hypothetical protein